MTRRNVKNESTARRGSAPTSADVARLAGVSQATISLVLNGRASNVRISDETRDRVIAAAAQLGYTPNHAARSLRQRSTKIITFVLPALDNPYYSDVISAAQVTAQQHGYAVSVIPTRARPGGFHALSLLQGAAFDGIIVAGHENCAAPELLQLAARGVAVVVLQQHGPDLAIHSVSVDLEAGGYLATRHLIGLGHRRIAHVMEELPPSDTRRDRIDGYRRALFEAGLSFDPSLVVITENSMAGGCKAIEQLLLSHQPPTAAFMYNDQMAVGALHALRTHGLRIPGDFAVVGFDGLAVGQFTAPPLTTIDHPRGDLGRLAVETLIGAIEKKSLEARERMLPVKLLVRESCGGKEAPLPQP
ncbi:LacI family DNA-binding transcriptional regulator [Microvirga sp. 3-52]|nr:LacI family DNA-binding transcriptional regulator [Microvirga sp. 3-52]